MTMGIAGWRGIAASFAAAVALLAAAPEGALSQAAAPEGREAFQRMVEYLADRGGRWIATNPMHEPGNRQSPDAYGLWFETAAGGRVLELTVVLHHGEEVRRGIRGYWMLHPGRDEVLYHEVSPGGGLRLGTTHFTDRNTFVTLTEAFGASGASVSNRGVNTIVGDDAHETTAFYRGADGAWVEQQSLTWTRVEQQGRR